MMKFVALFALIAVATAGEMKFKECGHGEVKHFRVSDCSGETCVTHRGQHLKMETEFVANQDTNKVEIQFYAIGNGQKFHVPGVETDGCKFLRCPIKKGEIQQFNFTLTVPTNHKNADAEIQEMLIGEHGNLICGSIHCKVI